MQTELQRQHERHKAFARNIAIRASQLRPVVKRSYSIPNTPYGVPKIIPRRPQFNLVVDNRPLPDADYDDAWHEEICGHSYYDLEIDRRITIRRIQRAVCQFYRLTHRELISSRRTKNLVRPRFIAYALCKELTRKSLPEIGRAFGRDHTTVLNGLRRVEILREAIDPIIDDIEAIRQLI